MKVRILFWLTICCINCNALGLVGRQPLGPLMLSHDTSLYVKGCKLDKLAYTIHDLNRTFSGHKISDLLIAAAKFTIRARWHMARRISEKFGCGYLFSAQLGQRSYRGILAPTLWWAIDFLSPLYQTGGCSGNVELELLTRGRGERLVRSACRFRTTIWLRQPSALSRRGRELLFYLQYTLPLSLGCKKQLYHWG